MAARIANISPRWLWGDPTAYTVSRANSGCRRCCYNAARNNPVSEHNHPRYTPLHKVADSAIKEAGLRFANGDDEPYLVPKANFLQRQWQELLEHAGILAEKFPDMRPVVFPLAVDDPMVATFLPMIAAYGGKLPIQWYGDNTYPEFQNEAGQQALDVLQKLTAYMPADVLDMDYDRRVLCRAP